MLPQQLCRVTQSFERNLVGILESSWSPHTDVYSMEIRHTAVSSLIRTPKGQYQVCALQRCLCYRDRKYSWLLNTHCKGTVSSVRIAEMLVLYRKYSQLFNTDSKGTVSSVRIAEMSMLQTQEIQLTLIRTPKGQYQVWALQRCVCYRYRKYSQLFNTHSKGTVSSVRIAEMSMLQRQEIKLTLYTDSKGTASSVRITEMPMLQRQEIQLAV